MATLTTLNGKLMDAQATTGVSANEVATDAWDAASITFDIAITGTATVQIERWNEAAGGYSLVPGSPTTASGFLSVDNPSARYQANVTARTSGTITVTYRLGPLRWHA